MNASTSTKGKDSRLLANLCRSTWLSYDGFNTVHCNFGNFLEQALRDRFVCGLRSEGAQKKLLTQTNLSFQKAVEIAQSMETAEANTKQIHSSASALQQVNKVLHLQRNHRMLSTNYGRVSNQRCRRAASDVASLTMIPPSAGTQLWQAWSHQTCVQAAKVKRLSCIECPGRLG